MPNKPPDRTLFTDILDWMMVPVIVLLPAAMVLTHLLSLSLANRTLDSALVDRLRIFASHAVWANEELRIDSHRMPKPLRDGVFHFSFQDEQGTVLLGDEGLPARRPQSDEGEDTVTASSHFLNEQVRTASMWIEVAGAPGRLLVTIAEPTAMRQALANEIMFDILAAQLVIVISMVLLMWFGLRRGTAPLEDLRTRVAGRPADDLSELDISGSPNEVRPLILAFNDLLARVRAMSDGQRRFIANAAHQLRTPLAGISTQAQLALRQADPELRTTLENISRGTARSSRLVTQLLALSRAEAMPLGGLQIESVDLCGLARETAEAALESANNKSIDLGVELPDEAVMVAGEPTLLRELLANLIDNAIKYSSAGGQVTVRLSPERTLEVEDHGIGIPVAERALVFERFHRVMGNREPGSGLGLAIVREVAAQHGATVNIDTPASGKGTLVRVTFPKPASRTGPQMAA